MKIFKGTFQEENMKNFSIKPTGALRRFLETQMDGLTGNIAAAGYPYDTATWGNPDYVPDEPVTWWPFEQTGYYIDGLTRCAVLLEDKKALEKAEKIIYSAIDNADEDGYIGPAFMKENKPLTVNRWAHVVFFRACMALFDYNGDMKIPRAIAAHYLGGSYDYSFDRDVLNAEILLWAYGVLRDGRLLAMAEKIHADYNAGEQKTTVTGDMLTDDTLLHKRKMFIHGVSYCEYSKLGAIFYMYTGNKKYLRVSEKALERLDKYYKLPNGCISSGEMTHKNSYDEVTETCDVSDYSWLLEYMLAATGDLKYADDIERCIFNAGIGAVTEDFRALQYFSCANQIITNEHSNHCRYMLGNSMMSYSPHPGTQCCPGNVNRFMPNYIMSMWDMRGREVYFNLFGASDFCGKTDGGDIKISVDTAYPLSDRLDFTVETKTPFILKIRIPQFSEGFDGIPSGAEEDGGYLILNIKENRRFSLEIKQNIKRHICHGGIYFTRGALTYSLGMKGERSAYAVDTVNGKEFVSYRMTADKPWNYAVISDCNPAFLCGKADVFDVNANIPSITVEARRIPKWELHPRKNYRCWNWKYETVIKKDGCYTFTPRLPDMKNAAVSPEKEKITLYPYGASKLRMTVLPVTEK